MVPAYCGLDCNECPVYLASIENNVDGQIQLAKEYSTDTCKLGEKICTVWLKQLAIKYKKAE